MKKFLTFLMLMVLLVPNALRADELIIGEGTNSTNNAPFANYYSNSWVEAIYPASEIGESGLITSISYYNVSQGSTLSTYDLRIYMAETTKNTMSSTSDWTPMADLELVYEHNDVVLGGDAGWQKFELDTPYLYEGKDNLVVVVAKKTYGYSGMAWQYTPTPNTCLVRRSDFSPDNYANHPGTNTDYTWVTDFRSNIKLDFTPKAVDCYKVLSLNVVETGKNTITIEWEPYPGQSEWDVFVSMTETPNEFTQPTATVSETSYTFTGLKGFSNYNVYVRGNCGSSTGKWKAAKASTDPDWNGAGTEEDPFLIYSRNDLYMLTVSMQNGFNTEGKYFLQMADIEGIDFAIGSGAKFPFRGVYDGNGYSVDLNIYGSHNQGFFETVGAGTIIRNLTTTGKVESQYWQTGGVVAYVDLSAGVAEGGRHVVIENCVNRANLKSNDNNVGGMLSDFNSNGTDYLYVRNCVNYGTITAISSSSYAGGIGGRMQKDAVIENCVNYGTINGPSYMGGVIAYPRTNVNIIDCCNYGEVKGTGERIGGISGYSSGGSIHNCYNAGTVTGNNYMGGIIGRLKASSENLGVVCNVYNAGAVVSSSNNTETTGALVGYNEGDYSVVTNAYYLEGVYGNAYGSTCNEALISNVSSFTQDAELAYKYHLTTAVEGTTNLVAALNAYEGLGSNEWYEDIYGNCKYLPTFNIGNPPGLEFNPSPLAMGPRAIGAQLHSEVVKVTNTGSLPMEVTLLELESESFITFDNTKENPQVPFILEAGKSVDVYITTKSDPSITAKEYTTSIVAMWNNQRTASIGTITATAYVPAEGDVVETAIAATMPMNAAVDGTSFANNYELPGSTPDASDVVYEINIDKDVLFSAEVDGNNAKIALYAENMNGELYPNTGNNYVGPAIAPVADLAFFYFGQDEFITHYGQGANGANVSAICGNCVNYGANLVHPSRSIVDDFSSAKDIVINEMEFFAYQTGSTTESTFTGLYVKIYDASPLEGGKVVWGDFENNILTYSEWTGVYRTMANDLDDEERPIMRLVASDLDINLPAGTYWVEVTSSGTLGSGPWGVPRSIWGQSASGNALLKEGDTYVPYLDSGYQLGMTMVLREGYSYRGRQMNINRNATSAASAASTELQESMTEAQIAQAAATRGEQNINNITLVPGKYYLVASSTSENYNVIASTATIPTPAQPTLVYPAYQAKNIEAPVTLRWNLPEYATEYQLLLGTTFPPTEVVVDWTRDLANGYQVIDLYSHSNYFWQVNVRNSSGTVEGPTWAFTTSLQVPQRLSIESSKLYPGNDAVLSWKDVNTRQHRGYNIYQDGVKINKTPVIATSYSISDLEYNMEGYAFNVTALYDAGESELSNTVNALMTGMGTVEGYTYEIDGVTPIAGVEVVLTGLDEYNKTTTVNLVSDENGFYSSEVLAGTYNGVATKEAYQSAQISNVVVAYDNLTTGANFTLREVFFPVEAIVAEEIDNNSVNTYWSWDEITVVEPFDPMWIYYDNGEYKSSIGTGQAAPCYWAVSFPNTEEYAGSVLSKVAVFDAAPDYAGTYTANIYLGGTTAPETLVATQSAQLVGVGDMVEIVLDTPVQIDGTQPLWITFYTSTVTYPAAGCAYVGETNSDWISLDGATWEHVATDYQLNYTWMIRGFLTDPNGTTRALSRESYKPQFEGGVSTGTFVADATAEAKYVGLPVIESNRNNRALKSYKLYRHNYFDGEITDENIVLVAEGITDTTYVDNGWATLEGGVYSWGVSAVYEGNRQAENESPIVWSNTLAKDMYTSVEVSVATNTEDSAEGTLVTFVNISEPEMGYDYEVALDATAYYEWPEFRKGTYSLTIMKAGFNSCARGEIMEIWDNTSVDCLLEEIAAAVNGLYVSPTGWAMWKNEPAVYGDEAMYDFEGGFQGWTTLDADGDDHNWYHIINTHSHNADPMPSHSGEGHVTSESFCFNEGALTPDNYLVSPQKFAIGSMSVLKFWAAVQDSNFPTEHFGIAVSTKSNDNPEDFTTIWETTMQAKGGVKGEGPRGTRDYGQWYQFEVDLSQYIGQNAYVAFRHFDSYDQFFLCVDDVELVNQFGGGNRSIVNYDVYLNGYLEDQITSTYYQHSNLIYGEYYTTTVVANYTTGSSDAMSYNWTAVKCDNFEGVSEFTAEYVNGNAVLNWVIPGMEPEVNAETFTYSFDTDLEGWTTIDGNADGHIWYHSTDSELYHAVLPSEPHSGAGYAGSESYCNYYGPLFPNDYFVTPQKYAVGNGAKISFWACSKDNSWASEHFGVAVSTASNTSEADFTTIAEWTMTGKAGAKSVRGRGEQGNWYQYEVDLSDYAGQEIYVAIRHFNTTDMFILMVDDVEITTAGRTRDSKEGTWMYYDDGNYVDGIGGPASFQWGIKLRAEDLAQYAPASLTKVSIYDRLSTSGVFNIYLGGNAAPQTKVHTQTYTLTGANDFVEIELTEAVAVDGAENVWVVFETTDGTNFPASCTASTGDADGRWISTDGVQWFDVLTGAGIDATWMIRAYIGESEGGEEDDDDDTETEALYLGAMLYRDGELITPEPIKTGTYSEPVEPGMEHEYCVRVVHAGALDSTYYAMSCPECIDFVAALPCDAPEGLYGVQATEGGQTGVSLVWPYSSPMSEWLYYDNGVNEDAIGGPASFTWGIMFPSAAIGGYDGTMLTKVAMFDYAVSTGDILIYYGGSSAPATLVHSQPYTTSGLGQFVEFELTAALPIDITQNLWVAFSTTQGANYPAAVCSDTGDPNGRWITLDGTTWEDVTAYGLYDTWMIRAYVTNEAKGEISSLAPITDYEYTVGTGEFKANGAAKGRSLDHYNIYRGTSANNFELIGESNEGKYFDAISTTGTYYYQVTAVYKANGEECESEPASAYDNPNNNYVVVDVVSIDENGVNGMMIYPNPTNGKLNITAEYMTRISITNTLGQTIYDQEVDSDNQIIDMTQYEAGVYMVRITTENGVAVERVTVVK